MTGNSLHLGANSTDGQLVINTSGNVGIGTTAPLVKLDVEGATLVGAGNNLVLGRTGMIMDTVCIWTLIMIFIG